MEDEAYIIFIALSNSLVMYNNSLEEAQNEEEAQLAEYIINRHLELIDKYSLMIESDDTETNKETKPIGRPQWEK